MATPATLPQTRPTSALVPVLRAALMISVWLRLIWCQMADGFGSRYGLMSRAMTNHCHRSRNRIPKPTAGERCTARRRCHGRSSVLDPDQRRRGRCRPTPRSASRTSVIFLKKSVASRVSSSRVAELDVDDGA